MVTLRPHGTAPRGKTSFGLEPIPLGGLYAGDRARAKPAPAKVRVHGMRQSRRSALLFALLVVGLAVGPAIGSPGHRWNTPRFTIRRREHPHPLRCLS